MRKSLILAALLSTCGPVSAQSAYSFDVYGRHFDIAVPSRCADISCISVWTSRHAPAHSAPRQADLRRVPAAVTKSVAAKKRVVAKSVVPKSVGAEPGEPKRHAVKPTRIAKARPTHLRPAAFAPSEVDETRTPEPVVSQPRAPAPTAARAPDTAMQAAPAMPAETKTKVDAAPAPVKAEALKTEAKAPPAKPDVKADVKAEPSPPKTDEPKKAEGKPTAGPTTTDVKTKPSTPGVVRQTDATPSAFKPETTKSALLTSELARSEPIATAPSSAPATDVRAEKNAVETDNAAPDVRVPLTPAEQTKITAALGQTDTTDTVDTAEAAESSPLGFWVTELDAAKVHIVSCGRDLCGYAVDTKTDKDGAVPLVRMKPAGARKWTGRINDMHGAGSYSSTISQKGADILHVQGCAFKGFMCDGQIWRRVI